MHYLTSELLCALQRGQGVPVEVRQACAEFSSGAQAVAGKASAAEDLGSHGRDLYSPEKLVTASQVENVQPRQLDCTMS